MAKKIQILKSYPKVKTKKGMLYHFNGKGQLVEMNPKTKKKTLVAGAAKVEKESGYLYYLKNGQYARSPMKRKRG